MNTRDQALHAETGTAAPPPPTYLRALAPLDPDEIRAAVATVVADPDLGPDALFETIELREPTPEAFRALAGGTPLPREARVNVFHRDRPGVWTVFVQLDESRITARKHAPTARPAVQVDQLLGVERAAKADPRFIEGCRRRGVADMAGVCVDAWLGGTFGFPDEEGRLIAHTFAWLRLRDNENLYAHPIEGLNAVVDIKTGEVLRVDDHGGPPIPLAEVNYDPDLLDSVRAPLKRLDVVQPDGVSFTVDGHALAWDRWTLGIGFSPRDGLILHDIRYAGRPIVRRAAIAELVVPYGSPERGHYRKNIFDIGEYGFGKLANSLTLGCDCLGAIHYLDAHHNTTAGEVVTIAKAICIHEEDAGVLWKHWDWRADRSVMRRGRKLVISTICTVGNYEYAQYWILTQAGDIQFDMKATGIINTAACEPGHPGRHGTEVAPGLVGFIHQHIFCARLDMAVDGGGNSVVETNSYAVPVGPENPHGNAFYAEDTVLRTELAACRRANADTSRSWKVVNPGVRNALGQPVAYRLHADHCVTPFIAEDGPSGRRSNFIRNHLWVTPFAADERYPAGEFVCNSDGSEGLAEIVRQDRAIEDTDVVVWHCFGLHHVVRPEDFPVQPSISTGFTLSPSGFFAGNPSNDLPKAVNRASVLAGAKGADGECCG